MAWPAVHHGIGWAEMDPPVPQIGGESRMHFWVAVKESLNLDSLRWIPVKSSAFKFNQWRMQSLSLDRAVDSFDSLKYDSMKPTERKDTPWMVCLLVLNLFWHVNPTFTFSFRCCAHSPFPPWDSWGFWRSWELRLNSEGDADAESDLTVMLEEEVVGTAVSSLRFVRSGLVLTQPSVAFAEAGLTLTAPVLMGGPEQMEGWGAAVSSAAFGCGCMREQWQNQDRSVDKWFAFGRITVMCDQIKISATP